MLKITKEEMQYNAKNTIRKNYSFSKKIWMLVLFCAVRLCTMIRGGGATKCYCAGIATKQDVIRTQGILIGEQPSC